MNGGYSQQARVLAGAFAHKLPDPDMEPEALELWRLADRFATADPRHAIENRRMLAEAYAMLGRVLGEG